MLPAVFQSYQAELFAELGIPQAGSAAPAVIDADAGSEATVVGSTATCVAKQKCEMEEGPQCNTGSMYNTSGGMSAARGKKCKFLPQTTEDITNNVERTGRAGLFEANMESMEGMTTGAATYAMVKEEDVVYMCIAETTGVEQQDVFEETVSQQALHKYASMYSYRFNKLEDEHHLHNGQAVDGSVDLILTDPPSTTRRHSALQCSEHD